MMRDEFLSFSPPSVGEEEIAEVTEALRSGWITTGPRVARFEEAFAELVGAEAALGLSSGTDAMQIGLASLGVGRGDEVITTPLTFCSTAHVIEHVGATPVLVDVEADMLCIDPTKVEAALSPKTKAILPVHLYGHPCDMAALLAIAEENKLHIVEDAAHALPAVFAGQTVGSIGDFTAFSFYATKNLTTAEGGMLTGSRDLVEKARPWALHGMSHDAHSRYESGGSWYYEVVLPGFKCNMTDLQAALGLRQLDKLEGFQRRRREIVERYHEAFSDVPALVLPVERPGVVSAWHLYVIRLDLERLTIDRAQFIDELAARNIGTSVHFIPVHLHPYYRDKYGFVPEDFPVTYEAYQRIVSLPLHPLLSNQDVSDVIEAVIDVADQNAR
jgi:dTDP-4-amino-4,6-dideoxygalactose transaminase